MDCPEQLTPMKCDYPLCFRAAAEFILVQRDGILQVWGIGSRCADHQYPPSLFDRRFHVRVSAEEAVVWTILYS